MNMTSNDWKIILQVAQKLAIEAHKEQEDKLGYAYIGHPRRVARNVKTVPLKDESLREAAVVAAWLHDVIEDSPKTSKDLLEAGIPDFIVTAVELVSKAEHEELKDTSTIHRKADSTAKKLPYYEAIKSNELARAVKLADLADNCNEVRTMELIAKGSPISDGKYPLALAMLELSSEEWTWFNDTVKVMPDRIIYVDMDNVIVDFKTGIEKLSDEARAKYPNDRGIDDEPHIFSKMEAYADSVAAVKQLAETNELYILSTAPWDNSTAWSDKLDWVHAHFGKGLFDEKTGDVNWLYKRLILSHHKHLNQGEYLIDDRLANGVKKFKGQHIHLTIEPDVQPQGDFKTWNEVLKFFASKGMTQ
jgi:5'(3')-deoxyribonucleotidase